MQRRGEVPAKVWPLTKSLQVCYNDPEKSDISSRMITGQNYEYIQR